MPITHEIDLTVVNWSSPTVIQQGSWTYAADTGAANAYVITLSPVPVLSAGSTFTFKATNANTGASTLNVNAIGAKTILKNGINALVANDIVAGQICTVEYDGTNFQLTASNLSSCIAVSDLTAQAAAISATTLYAVPATGAGFYRISFVAKITQAATTSSTLGGAGGFQALYTDQDDSVVVTSGTIANLSGSSLTGNTTQITYMGSALVNAKASTNIQYQFGYTSSGATVMQYNLHIRVERY